MEKRNATIIKQVEVDLEESLSRDFRNCIYQAIMDKGYSKILDQLPYSEQEKVEVFNAISEALNQVYVTTLITQLLPFKKIRVSLIDDGKSNKVSKQNLSKQRSQK